MIKVRCNPTPPQITIYVAKSEKALDGLTKVTKAEWELEKAVVFFTDPANYADDAKKTKAKFSFRVYQDSDLAAELEKVFGKKCAYCESRFAHVTSKDIEHYRPKAEIDTGQGTLQPGYFWLGGEWQNLLISCPHCNRVRHHKVPGQPEEIKLGKGTQFPLADEKLRVRNQGDVNGEDPVRLLLNPRVDDPQEHLTFDADALIHPRADANGQPSAKGSASITAYALQRAELVNERLVVLNRLELRVMDLNDLIETHNDLIAHGLDTTRNAAQIKRIKEEIDQMFAANAPYLAMLREWIRRAKQRGDFARIEQLHIDLAVLGQE